MSETGRLPKPKARRGEKKETEPKKQDRAAIVQAVTSPLGFFALAVLVCEAIIGTTTVASKLTGQQQYDIILLMIALVAVMIGLVSFAAWYRPHILSPEMADAHLREEIQKAEDAAHQALNLSEQLSQLIADEGFRAVIESIVDEKNKTLLPKE